MLELTKLDLNERNLEGLLETDKGKALDGGDTAAFKDCRGSDPGEKDAGQVNGQPGAGTVPTLTELLHVARQERSQNTLAQRKMVEATRIHVTLAEQRRLALHARECRQLMVQCIRTENKPAFTTLYHALVKPIPEPKEEIPGWFEDLLPASKNAVVSFLTKLRYDGDFLGSQLASLPPKTLLSLLPQDPRESVLAGPAKEEVAIDRALDELVKPSASLESLVLLTGELATDVWGTACARLIIDQRPIHERVVVHLMNLWAARSSNQAMELWFAETLQKGNFPMRTFRQHKYTNDDAREAFFDDALERLLVLILDTIPASVLELCSAIRKKLELSPKHHCAFPTFAATKWLFLSYIPKLLLSPESFGILVDHHISEQARTRIFKELCDRAQRVVFEVAYPWRHQTQIHQGHAKHVRAIFAVFSTPTPVSKPSRLTSVAVSGPQLLALLKVLSTPRRPESVSSGLHSSASSMSGFSLFRKDSGSSLEMTPQPDEPGMTSELVALHHDLQDVLSMHDEQSWSLFMLDDSQSSVRSPLDPAPSLAGLLDSNYSNLGLPGSVLSDGASARTESTGLTAQSSKTSMTSIPEWHDDPVQDEDWMLDLIQLCLDEADSDNMLQLGKHAISTYQRHGDHLEAYTLVQLLQRYDKQPTDILGRTFGKFQQRLTSQEELVKKLKQSLIDADHASAVLRRELKSNDALLKQLRYKIWYSVHVKSSAIYERLSDTVVALRAMEQQRTSPLQARTTNQILDLLSAPPEHGGPNKFSNDQCRAVRNWLDRNQIEMLCTEERIHKLCMEVRHCVEALTNPSPTENPMLWMDSLFTEDKKDSRPRLRSRTSSLFSSSTPRPPTAYSAILALVLSDVTLFNQGAETDRAMWTGIANEMLIDFTRLEWPAAFDHHAALSHMMRTFTLTSSPLKKLEILQSMQKFAPNADAWVAIFAEFRPVTLLRDMQYIASLLPQSAMDDAFWHASVAVVKIKQRLVKSMLETADEIVAFHTNNRRHRPSTAQQSRDAAFTHPPNEMSYTMTDAARLLEIAAKEGNPTAQRELATLYLTHPELMRPVIAPLTPPKDVFRQELEGKWQDKQRCDPLIMCVAHHWMMLSSKGGDALAKEFIKQQEEMERLP